MSSIASSQHYQLPKNPVTILIESSTNANFMCSNFSKELILLPSLCKTEESIMQIGYHHGSHHQSSPIIMRTLPQGPWSFGSGQSPSKVLGMLKGT